MKQIILFIMGLLMLSIQFCYGYDSEVCAKAANADSEARIVQCEDFTFAVETKVFDNQYRQDTACGFTLEAARIERESWINFMRDGYMKQCKRVDIIKPEVIIK